VDSWRYSTQSIERVTAFFQELYKVSRSELSILGYQIWSTAQLAFKSSRSLSKPIANPAAYAGAASLESRDVPQGYLVCLLGTA